MKEGNVGLCMECGFCLQSLVVLCCCVCSMLYGGVISPTFCIVKWVSPNHLQIFEGVCEYNLFRKTK